VQVIPATSDSNVGDAAAITSAFNHLNGFNRPEPSDAIGTQNQGFNALLPADTQLGFNVGDTDQNLIAYLAGGNLIATRQALSRTCRVNCILAVCHIHCKSKG
jgi:hypothetical protein